MMRSLFFIAQLFGLSALISLAVKLGGPYLPEMSPHLPLVLLMISLPAIGVTSLLLWFQFSRDTSAAPPEGEEAPE